MILLSDYEGSNKKLYLVTFWYRATWLPMQRPEFDDCFLVGCNICSKYGLICKNQNCHNWGIVSKMS